MATNRRDIELLISARETTGRSFKQVTDNIAALNAKIAEQITQAEKGEVSLQDLRRTQEQLAQAGRDLSAIQGQIDAYNKLAGATDALADKAAKAQKDLDAFRAKLAEGEKVTERQEQKLQRLENAVVRTSAAVEKNKTDLAEQVAVLERAGVATGQLEQAQTGIVNSARNVGSGLTQVRTAIDGYADNVARVRTEEAALAAQQGFERKIAEAQRLGQASRFVQLFADAIQTANVADNQLSALTGFRAVGQSALEASNDISRFVQAGQSMAITSSQVAAGLRAIVDPGAVALQTLRGVEAAIEQADTTAAEGVKNVGLLNDAYNNLAAAASALVRQGALVDSFRNQEVAVAAARAQFDQAQAEVQQYARAMAQADQPTEQLARSLQLAEAKLQETGRALAQEETKLGELSRSLRAAEINTADLAGEQARLEAAATRVGSTMERVNTTLGRGGRATNGLFGLKPNDLANLSFQLNDIFVSLASGQNPFIVLIQQGSQIGQLFPGIISTVARLAVAFSPLIIAATALGAAFYELYTDSERLKQAQEDLARVPGGGALDPERYAAAQEKLEGVAKSAEDARAAMLLLAEEGFSIDQIESYSEAAKNLAERLGIDVTEATQMLVDVQKGGIETVYDLAEKTNDLTGAELDHAEALFNAGKAAEARQYILDRVAEKNAAIAKATRSQWTPAVDNLKLAWQNFVGWLGKVLGPFLDWVQQKINNTVVGLTFVSAILAGKGLDGAKNEAFDVIRQQRGLNGPNGGAPAPGASDQDIRDRRYLQTLDEEAAANKDLTRQERLRRAEIDARRKAQEAGVSAAVEERAVQQAIAAEEKKINEESERSAKRSRSARNKADRERLAAAREIASLQRQLNTQMDSLERDAARGPSASLESRLDAIDSKYKKIGDTISALRAKGITTAEDGTSLADLEKSVEATKSRLKDEERIKYYQEQATLLEKQRQAEIDVINDKRKRGLISEAEAIKQAEEVNSRLSPQIVAAANEALRLARAVAGTNPSPEMVSLIASLERLSLGEQNNGIVADVGLKGLEDADKKLADLTRERDELVRSYQTLNELGLQSDAETRDLTAQAYARTAEAQRPVIANLREQVELLRQTGIISETAYQTWIAKLDAAEAGLVAVDSRIAQINQAAMNGIAQGVTNAFNTVGSSIAGLITGTQSWGDALNSVINAGLSLMASFLKAIADVLVQMVALQVAKSIIGGATGGFGGLFFHDGGVVGKQGGSYKKVTGGSGSWLGAPKFHGGGGLGLKPDEYKAVLQRGEEVLTTNDPRHINNLGKGGGQQQQPPIKQVLLLDPEAVPNAMQSRSGTKSILTVIRQNKETIKQVLG